MPAHLASCATKTKLCEAPANSSSPKADSSHQSSDAVFSDSALPEPKPDSTQVPPQTSLADSGANDRVSDSNVLRPDSGVVDGAVRDQGIMISADMSMPDMSIPNASCDDMQRNGTETDIDCGGVCAPCSDRQSCITFRDCISGVCAGGFCLPAACHDGIKNGSETDGTAVASVRAVFMD